MSREGADLPDVGLLLTHTDHDALVTWTTDNGSVGCVSDRERLVDTRYVRENCTGGIVA